MGDKRQPAAVSGRLGLRLGPSTGRRGYRASGGQSNHLSRPPGPLPFQSWRVCAARRAYAPKVGARALWPQYPRSGYLGVRRLTAGRRPEREAAEAEEEAEGVGGVAAAAAWSLFTPVRPGGRRASSLQPCKQADQVDTHGHSCQDCVTGKRRSYHF